MYKNCIRGFPLLTSKNKDTKPMKIIHLYKDSQQYGAILHGMALQTAVLRVEICP